MNNYVAASEFEKFEPHIGRDDIKPYFDRFADLIEKCIGLASVYQKNKEMKDTSNSDSLA